MKIKPLTTPTGRNILVVEIPEGIDIRKLMTPYEGKIMGSIKNGVVDFDIPFAKNKYGEAGQEYSIGDKCVSNSLGVITLTNQSNVNGAYSHKLPKLMTKEEFISFLESQGIPVRNKYGEKEPNYNSGKTLAESALNLEQWQAAEDDVWHNFLIIEKL